MDLSIHIAPDGLAASLVLPRRRTIAADLMARLLPRAGVVSGIDAAAVAAAAEPSDEDRDLVVARGDPGAPEAPAHADLALALGAEVVGGQMVGTWKEASAARPGRTVGGLPLAPPAMPDEGWWTGLGEGLAKAPDGRVVALRAGRLEGVVGCLRVPPPEIAEKKLEAVTVNLEGDGMEAWVAMGAGETVAPEILRAAIAAVQVVFGIDPVAELRCATLRPAFERVVVARGEEPVHGLEARLEHLAPRLRHPVATHVDERNLHARGHLYDVAAGAILARVHPATPGRPGHTVRGQEIPAKAGVSHDHSGSAGDGVGRAPDDAAVLVALKPGVALLHGNKWTVGDAVDVPDDLDQRWGAVTTAFGVKIGGDIKAGHALKSGGAVAVGGGIENARVSALGDLTVQGGVLPGDQRVKTRGVLKARHVLGRTIKAHDVVVANSIRAAVVLATGTVKAREIAGSRVVSAGAIEVERLGDDAHVATVVQIGINPYELALVEAAERSHDEISRALCECKETVKLIARHLKQARDPALRDALSHDLRVVATAFEQQAVALARCEEALALRERLRAVPDAGVTVTVRGTVYRGVEVLIGRDARLVVPHDVSNTTFFFAGGQVAMK